MNWTNDVIDRIIILAKSGETRKSIAKDLGCTLKALNNKLNRLGIKTSDLSMTTMTKTCIHCGTDFLVRKLYNKKYCSKKCAIEHHALERKQKQKYCLYCSQLLHTGSKYCNNTCKSNYINNKLTEQWLVGEISGHTNGHSYDLRTFVKKYMFEQAGHKCEECGCDKVNPYTGNSVLQIDHIDGDASNSRRDNLKVLCPTCHAMTPTFGFIGSKKSARHTYRKNQRNK